MTCIRYLSGSLWMDVRRGKYCTRSKVAPIFVTRKQAISGKFHTSQNDPKPNSLLGLVARNTASDFAALER